MTRSILKTKNDTKKKGFLVKTLAILVLFNIFQSNVYSQKVGDKFSKDGLFYKILSLNKNKVAITGQKDSGVFRWNLDQDPIGNINIPGTIEYNDKNYLVTKIEKGTFSLCHKIKSVTISDENIEKIEENAFLNCHGLTSLKIGNSVTSIEANSFASCTELSSVVLSNKLKEIGKGAFSSDISLENIEFPNSLEIIGEGAFWACSKIKNIDIPDSVIHIRGNVFSGCKSLEFVNLGKNIKSIGNSVFDTCGLLQLIISNIPSFEDVLFGSKSIFKEVKKTSCKIYVSDNDEIKKYKENIDWKDFDFKTINNIIKVSGIKLNVSEKNIGIDQEFFLKTTIEPLEATNKAITWRSENPNIATINSKGKVKGISGGFTNILVKTIDGKLLAKCAVTVTSEKIGNKFKVGGLYYRVTQLSPLEVSVATPKDKEYSWWYGITKPSGIIEVPKQVKHNNRTYIVTGLENNVFNECERITEVILPETIQKIGTAALSWCSDLKKINLPKSLYYIGEDAFSYCNELKNITIPEGIKQIRKRTFSNCKKITNINLPSSLTSIGASAFSFCSVLETITIPEKVNYISRDAFSGCKLFTKIIIPDSVLYIGQEAFSNCDKLETIKLSNSLKSIEMSTFKSCKNLKTITIPLAVKNIGRWAFINCKNLKKITCLSPEPPNAFIDTFKNVAKGSCNLIILKGSKVKYENHNAWKDFLLIEQDKKVVYATGISFTNKITRLKFEGTSTLNIKITPDNVTSKKIAWNSDNEKNIIVDSEGNITAKHIGEATITAQTTDGSNKKVSCKIIVILPVDRIILLGGDGKTMEKGESYKINYLIEPIKASNKKVIWTSQNKDVATVDNTGKVTALRDGKTIITATTEDGKKEDSFKIHVTKRIKGISFVNTSYPYDGNPKSLAITGKLPVGTSVKYSLNNSKINVGTYIITATIDGGTNYSNLVLKADLKITKATITGISFVNTSYPYDGTLKSLAITGKLPIGTNVKYSLNNSKTNVGTYTITATIDGGTNYNNLVLTADLEITKASITKISFLNTSYAYNGNPKSLAITGKLPVGTSVKYSLNNSRTNVGTHTITATINGGTNYSNLVLKADLKITKAPQTITWNQNLSLNCNGNNTLILTGTSSSGLPVNYTSSDVKKAVVTGTSLKVLLQENVTITASQKGNDNYLPAKSVANNFIIILKNLIYQHFDNTLFFNNSSNKYVSWEWYKDDKLVKTSQYYTENQSLNGTFYVKVKDINGIIYKTCPVKIVSSTPRLKTMVLFPNPVNKGANFKVKTGYTADQLKGSVITITNMFGQKISQHNNITQENEIKTQNMLGVYIVKLQLQNGVHVTKNLLVK